MDRGNNMDFKQLSANQEETINKEAGRIGELFPQADIGEVAVYMIEHNEASPIRAYATLHGEEWQQDFDSRVEKAEQNLGVKLNREELVERMAELKTNDPREAILALNDAHQMDSVIEGELIKTPEDKGVDEDIDKTNLQENLAKSLSTFDEEKYDKHGRKIIPEIETGVSNLQPSEKKDWEVQAEERKIEANELNQKAKEERQTRGNKLQDAMDPYLSNEDETLGKELVKSAGGIVK